MIEKGKSSRCHAARKHRISRTFFFGVGTGAGGVLMQEPGAGKPLSAFLPDTEKRCFSTPPFDR